MRKVTGAILLAASEQAFAHAYAGQFPHQIVVMQVLLPASLVLSAFGVGFLLWGVFADGK